MQSEKLVLPRHIGVIMDGNGRWAKKRFLPRKAGHSQGAKVFKKIARYANKIGIECMTFYAFSTENWKRPYDEVNALMNIFRDYLKDAKNFKDDNIKLRFIGDRSVLDDDLVELMIDAEEDSADATGMVLNLAINYGGQDEIVNAINAFMDENPGTQITKEDLEKYLYTSDNPPLDLVIRPSGEFRLSNFLIWQSADAELCFMDIIWPDFTEKELDIAIHSFSERNRRFGGV